MEKLGLDLSLLSYENCFMSKSSPDCAAVLRILADQTRLGVVRLLLQCPRRVSELNAVLKIDQSLLSHHLQILRRHGIVVSRRVGKSVLYRLSPDLVDEAEKMAMEHGRSARVLDLGCCRLSFEAAEEPGRIRQQTR